MSTSWARTSLLDVSELQGLGIAALPNWPHLPAPCVLRSSSDLLLTDTSSPSLLQSRYLPSWEKVRAAACIPA